MNLIGTALDIALFPYTRRPRSCGQFTSGSSQSPLAKAMLTPLVGAVYGISCVD
jgi:hypothetical protein